MNKRNHYPAEFKTKVVLEVIQEASTVNEIAAKYGISPVVISRWKQEFLERAAEVFKKGPSDAEKELDKQQRHVAELERKVGQLTYEVDWLKKNLSKLSEPTGRKSFVDRDNPRISVKRQAQLLSINRSSVYRRISEQKTLSDAELFVMRRIDEIHTGEPTWGYRTITTILRRDYGLLINRKRVRRILRDMGIYTIYPKPNLSKRYHSQYIRPYLLRKLEINRPDQVWGIDITYIRMKKGFMYLFVIIDWYSRYIVDYELSSTLDKSFVLSCLKRAMSHRKPEIINSDQEGHFTNPDYILLLESAGVKISMDGRGQCLDNARVYPELCVNFKIDER
ncbi:transposase IS3/IS911 family protein [Syntrophobotulus glycolicus DSM 8271]|uniref:Transposase IS3/IS911 family protein n=1 Tax=Syntrophobotulus glycolicus (strain DSM 8271 / FlGlyR) TaxID=645991 RepID=F0T0N4_SYNGF|nr:transposase IS3/IS911 family protein [Syntrophobotulus glycolicus DSM 8271]